MNENNNNIKIQYRKLTNNNINSDIKKEIFSIKINNKNIYFDSDQIKDPTCCWYSSEDLLINTTIIDEDFVNNLNIFDNDHQFNIIRVIMKYNTKFLIFNENKNSLMVSSKEFNNTIYKKINNMMRYKSVNKFTLSEDNFNIFSPCINILLNNIQTDNQNKKIKIKKNFEIFNCRGVNNVKFLTLDAYLCSRIGLHCDTKEKTQRKRKINEINKNKNTLHIDNFLKQNNNFITIKKLECQKLLTYCNNDNKLMNTEVDAKDILHFIDQETEEDYMKGLIFSKLIEDGRWRMKPFEALATPDITSTIRFSYDLDQVSNLYIANNFPS